MGVRIINNNQGGNIKLLKTSPGTNPGGVWLGYYILDSYPGAIASYSLRKLSSRYFGPTIRVRRDSDNTEQDIGFAFSSEGFKLDENALTAFVGNANGFVTKWYDQSGNGVDQASSVASQQPQIVTSGTTYTSNGKLALYFNGSMQMNSIINIFPTSVAGEWSSFGVIHPLVYDLGRVYLSSDTVGNRIGQFLGTGNNVNRFYRTVAFDTLGSAFTDLGPAYTFTQAIVNAIRTSTTIEVFANGASNGSTATTGTPKTGTTSLNITYTPTFRPLGYIQELIHYPLDSTSFYQNMVVSINSYYKTY